MVPPIQNRNLTNQEKAGFQLVQVAYLNQKTGAYSSPSYDYATAEIFKKCKEYGARLVFRVSHPMDPIGFYEVKFISVPKNLSKIFKQDLISTLSTIDNIRPKVELISSDLTIRIKLSNGFLGQNHDFIDLALRPWDFTDPGKTLNPSFPFNSRPHLFLSQLQKTRKLPPDLQLKIQKLIQKRSKLIEFQLKSPEPKLWDGYERIRL